MAVVNGKASIEGREGGCEMKVLEDGCEERAWRGVVAKRGRVRSGCEERAWQGGCEERHGEELQGEGVAGVVVRRGCGRSGCEERAYGGVVVRRAWQEQL